MTWNTDYGHIYNIGSTGYLPEAKCRSDPIPLWTS